MARTPITLLCTAILVMVGCVAKPHATDNDDRRVALETLSKPQRARLTAADTNHNGLLGGRELARYYKKLAREQFRKLDANGDGKLQRDEIPPELLVHLVSADHRADGPITLDEFVAARNHRLIHNLRAADRDGNHALSRDEVGPLRWVRLRMADRNHNGVVTFAELEQAFARHAPFAPAAVHQ